MLDVCCGPRMMWFEANNPLAIYADKRIVISEKLCDGRKLNIIPNVVCDFTALPFPDSAFYLVVFDPPHMESIGQNSWLAKKYGRLLPDWRDDIAEGFRECFRVLKLYGTLVFKWNTTDIGAEEVLSLSPIRPAFGHTTGRQAKTIWATFIKSNN